MRHTHFNPSNSRIDAVLLLSLSLLAAMAPFAIDLYLPAFPEMIDDLRSTTSGVQLTLTAFLVGIASGQLFFGVVSDRFGRRVPLLIGLVVCVIASSAAALAPSLEVLVAARAAQGFTGAAGVVIGRAIVVDLAGGDATAKSLSLMAAIGGIAPVVAPVVGGFLTPFVGWRGMLWTLAGISLVMLIVSALFIPETLREREQNRGNARSSARLGLLLRPRFAAYTSVLVLSFGGFMGYIAASPFVFQEIIGLSPTVFGVVFGMNALISILTGIYSSRTVHRWGAHRLLGAGQLILVSSSISVLALALFPGREGWMLLSFAGMSSSIGLILGNSTALALNQVREIAGSGSAALGALQFTAGAALSPIVGVAGSASALPLGIVMAVSSGASLLIFTLIRRPPLTTSRE